MKVNHSRKAYPVLNIFDKASSQAKISQARGKSFWTPANTIFVGSSLVILLASSTVIFTEIFSSFSPSLFLSTFIDGSQENYHPTSLPWIRDESDCLHRGRTWNQGECWDKEHSSMF
ncbi:MAG: hypothetical protein HC903_08520 [Methylacidiphilales bacterium]|nr:hypothetical protein [Candidatus Methylacidiphilales bacterium]NJR15744.1 hypothetical protein [Calothrix sp. CSU_2_0]